MVKKLDSNSAGWRTVYQIAQQTRLPVSALYDKAGRTSPMIGELEKRGFVERKTTTGVRGEVVHFRISYDKEPIREYINEQVRARAQKK